VHSIAGW